MVKYGIDIVPSVENASIGYTDDQLIADRVADMAAITPTASGEYIAKSRNDFLASEIEPLEKQLNAAYEALEQEHEHEQELVETVKQAATPECHTNLNQQSAESNPIVG